MDGVKTAPFSLKPPQPTAVGSVLLLHGFTGSPWEVRPLGEALAARGYHVEAPLLPGHGSDGEAMAFVTWRDWELHSLAALEKLPPHPRTFIAGLSMGALLAVLLASRRPKTVSRLALLAPAYRLKPWSGKLLRQLRFAKDSWAFNRWLSKDASDIEDPVARADNPVMPKYPLARLLDLFMLQDLVRMAVTQVRAKALLMVSEHDHVIDPAGVVELHRALKDSQLVRLQRGYHIVTRDTERARVAADVGSFFDAP